MLSAACPDHLTIVHSSQLAHWWRMLALLLSVCAVVQTASAQDDSEPSSENGRGRVNMGSVDLCALH